jgi:hypothetical protein
MRRETPKTSEKVKTVHKKVNLLSGTILGVCSTPWLGFIMCLSDLTHNLFPLIPQNPIRIIFHARIYIKNHFGFIFLIILWPYRKIRVVRITIASKTDPRILNLL